MSNKIMALVIATMVAGSASSAFAASSHHREHARAQQIERYSDPQLFEGRNSAPVSDYSAGATSTGRDAMVQELGN
jgi:hypothetical protein